MKTRRQHILDTLEDSIGDLVYYDRKEDSDLPVDAIQAAVKAGEITAEEMIEHWAALLRRALE